MQGETAFQIHDLFLMLEYGMCHLTIATISLLYLTVARVVNISQVADCHLLFRGSLRVQVGGHDPRLQVQIALTGYL